jgi:hypothetical protein
MTRDALKSFRQQTNGCEIALLMDLRARTVLAWDSDLKWPQERLDDLCALAIGLLEPGTAGDSAPGQKRAMLARRTGCWAFLRAAPNAAEVLGCVLAPQSDTDGLFERAAALCATLPASDAAGRD